MRNITPEKIVKMPYVELMALLNEINRPPGGKDSIRIVAQNTFLNKDSLVLDVGCNTGFCSFEIAHLVKCRVIGIDISSSMVKTANYFKERDSLGYLVKFIVGDAENMHFKDNTFDLVLSGGSTAFIEDKYKAIKEYKRVVKPWGFIADINFFYRKKVPLRIIRELRKILGVNIHPWNKKFWLHLYEAHNLEIYFIHENDLEPVSKERVREYSIKMVNNTDFDSSTKKALLERLLKIMSLFNENHKYLSYAIFILRKRSLSEQDFLFSP